MEYWQQKEVDDTYAVCKIMEAAIEMVVASANVQIKEYPRSDISGHLHDFINGLDDLKADTFDVAMSVVQRLENDEDHAEYMAERRGMIDAYNSCLGIKTS